MKKLMLAAIAAVSLGAANAADTRTAAEYRAIADQMLATGSNRTACIAIATSNDFRQITWRKDLADTRLAIDREFADAGVPYNAMYPVQWPRASKLARDVAGITTSMPIRVSLGEKYSANLGAGWLREAGATPAELAALLAETVRLYVAGFTLPYMDQLLVDDKVALQDVAVRAVKKLLRSQGKSFVTKNGVNPCAAYVDRLNAALNAPRFAGMNEWFAEMGIDVSMDLSSLPSDSAVAALKTQILNGDKDLTTTDKRILSICLGTDGYNAFVKEYNGD